MRRFAILSLGLHVALLVGLVLWFRHHPPTASDEPDTQGEVELVMLEQQGTGAMVVVPKPAPPTATKSPEATTKPAESAATPPPPPPPEPDKVNDAGEPLPLPPPSPPAPQTQPPPVPQPTATQPSAQPSAPKPPAEAPPVQQAMEVPQINIGGNDSETNAIVTGDRVVPASLDAKFHNKEPIYPIEAARRAEQGAVILVVHVSPDGLVQGIDVEQSSGFMLLDRAARDAVVGWHFLPAVKDGQPVPFDMQLRVLFQLD